MTPTKKIELLSLFDMLHHNRFRRFKSLQSSSKRMRDNSSPEIKIYPVVLLD